MGHRQKAAKRKKDRLSELPDEILSTIISLLPLKEAVRTSLVSKSWRFIWTNHPNLLFNCFNIIGSTIYSDSDKQQQRQKFIQLVDHLMEQRNRGPKIDSLAIHFHLGKDSTANIDHWISCAVAKGAEKIDLDLSEWRSFKVDYAASTSTSIEPYTFPFWQLLSKECNLKHLQLASCNLGSLQNSSRLSSLVTVELRGLKISDEQMEGFLSVCSSLENLTVHHCKDLVGFKFAGARFPLKFLSIKYCFELKNVGICAKNLGTLEYAGQVVDFLFKDVLNLAQIFLSFTGMNRNEGLTSTVARFAYHLPQVETLNLISILGMKDLKLPEEVPTFTNIKQLVLTVFPFQDEDELYWISYILKAFPSLNKLQLNLFCPSFIRWVRAIERNLPECPHRNLKELEINGFNWNKHEVDLLMYLIENAVGLEVLVVNPSPKVYKGIDNWVYDEKNCLYEFSAKCVEWLHTAVPRSVRLDIR